MVRYNIVKLVRCREHLLDWANLVRECKEIFLLVPVANLYSLVILDNLVLVVKLVNKVANLVSLAVKLDSPSNKANLGNLLVTLDNLWVNLVKP